MIGPRAHSELLTLTIRTERREAPSRVSWSHQFSDLETTLPLIKMENSLFKSILTLTTSLLLSELKHSLLHSGVGCWVMGGSVAVSGSDTCRCCAIVPWRGLALETQLPLSVPCPAAADSVTWIMLCTVCNSATLHPSPSHQLAGVRGLAETSSRQCDCLVETHRSVTPEQAIYSLQLSGAVSYMETSNMQAQHRTVPM